MDELYFFMQHFLRNLGLFVLAAIVLYFVFRAVAPKIVISLDYGVTATSTASSSGSLLLDSYEPGTGGAGLENSRGGAGGTVVSRTGLRYKDDLIGTGTEAQVGKKVTVHYTGTLTSGVKFDSSVDRKAPFSFVLGSGQVIQGWEEGIQGMKVGGKRVLTIPPELGYGARSMGSIPANSTLLFSVELLKVE